MEQLRYKLRGVFADTPARDTTEDFCGSVLQRLQADYAAGTFRSTLVQYQMWALDILRTGTWDFWSFARGRGRSWGCSLLEQCTMFRTVRAAADSCEFDVEEACAAPGVECAHGFVPEAGVSISPALSEAVTQVIVTWGLDPVQRLTHLSTLPPNLGVKFLGLRFAIVFSGIEKGVQNPVDKWVNLPQRRGGGTFDDGRFAGVQVPEML